MINFSLVHFFPWNIFLMWEKKKDSSELTGANLTSQSHKFGNWRLKYHIINSLKNYHFNSFNKFLFWSEWPWNPSTLSYFEVRFLPFLWNSWNKRRKNTLNIFLSWVRWINLQTQPSKLFWTLLFIFLCLTFSKDV